jgi:hypothetical protein
MIAERHAVRGPSVVTQRDDEAGVPTSAEGVGDVTEHELAAPTIAHSPAALQRSEPVRPSKSFSIRDTIRGSLHSPDDSSSSAPLHSSLSPTAMRALHAEEAVRARGFGRIVALLAGMTLPMILALSGPTWLRLLAAASVLALGVLAAWVWWRGANVDHYSRRVFRSFGWTSVVTSLVLHLYFGVFSPTPVVTTLGIAFFGLGDDRRFAFLICGAASLGYGLLAILLLLGVIPDYGLLSPATSSLGPRLFMAIMVPALFSVMLWHARLSRHATYAALERAQEATREARRREALAEEANLGLEQILRAGAGQVGHRSGEQVGAYVLAEMLGRGGMGEVYAAVHVGTGHRAAIKLLTARSLEKPDLIERFSREAMITASLRAPNVVQVFEFGKTDDGAPFIAMELLRGQNLGAILRQRTQLSVNEVLVLAEQVGRGLTAAHQAGVVHRDLKPQNLFLVPEEEEEGVGTWKILDFGVSKLIASSGTLTDVGIVGTPGYMSPEQAQGRKAGPKSDVFALGAVVYRALTGRPPFSGPDVPQILFEIVYRAPPRPSELMPDLAPDVDLVLALALAKSADLRFDSGEDFAAALAAAAKAELSAPLRVRGQALVAKMPWGRKVPDHPA